MGLVSLIEPNTTMRPPLNLVEAFKATFEGKILPKKHAKRLLSG
jgi:hypothetical protein